MFMEQKVIGQISQVKKEVTKFHQVIQKYEGHKDNERANDEGDWEDFEEQSDEEVEQYCMQSKKGVKRLSRSDVHNILHYAMTMQMNHD